MILKVGRGGGYHGVPWVVADPPTHQIRNMFLRGKKMKFIEGAGKWRPILGTKTCLWPPLRYGIGRPLSNPLPVAVNKILDHMPTTLQLTIHD